MHWGYWVLIAAAVVLILNVALLFYVMLVATHDEE
jgi:hypothetical protein